VPPEDLLRQRNGFVASAREVLERIAAGEVYQVNLSAEVAVPISEWPAPLRALAAVQAVQPVPFAAVFRGQSHLLISGSMERFLAVRGAQVSSRPIKGTAPRRTDPLQDAAEARSLRASAKECAENTMIVDMVRNDLQRAARRGSVRVTDLLATEPYATLWHLESEIAASLTRPRRLDALLEATMPAASVTGCPKIQAMRVIAQLERRRRGPYCGAVGLALPGGPVDLAVAIRTLWLDEHQARFAVGAGLVADSVPEAEWLETCLKARSPLAILASIQEPRAIPEGP
jgi:anthranilate/para-aminobenzoate synthase component I